MATDLTARSSHGGDGTRGLAVLLFWVARGCVVGMVLLASAACMPGTVTRQSDVQRYDGPLPRPTRILIYDFAGPADQVVHGEARGAQLASSVQRAPGTEHERAIGLEMADVLSQELVEELGGLGVPVQRGVGDPPQGQTVLMITGRLLPGAGENRSQGVAGGPAMEPSQVQARVQLTESSPTGRFLVEQFTGDARPAELARHVRALFAAKGWNAAHHPPG